MIELFQGHTFVPGDLTETVSIREQNFRDGIGAREARRAASDYVRQNHRGCVCAFLVGSYARGDEIAQSDVDIFVIDDRAGLPLVTQSLFGNYPVQANILNSSAAWLLMENDYRSSSFYILAAFARAEYLTGHRDLHEAIVRRALELWKMGAPAPNAARISSVRTTIINQLIKLSRSSDAPLRFTACAKLLECFAHYIQLTAGTWSSGDVPYDSFLDHSPEYQRALTAVPKALAGDPGHLLDIIHDFLAIHGEVFWSTDCAGLAPFSK